MQPEVTHPEVENLGHAYRIRGCFLTDSNREEDARVDKPWITPRGGSSH